MCYSHRNLQHIKLQSFYRLQLMIHDPHDCLNRRPPWPNVAFDPSDPAYLKLKEVGYGGVLKAVDSKRVTEKFKKTQSFTNVAFDLSFHSAVVSSIQVIMMLRAFKCALPNWILL